MNTQSQSKINSKTRHLIKRGTKSRSRKGKKSKAISLNLMNKFEIVKATKTIDFNNLENNNTTITYKENQYSNTSVSLHAHPLTEEQLYNEILNKFNYFQQLINFKDELNKSYVFEVQTFLDFFMNLFNKIYKTINLQEIKECFSRLENLICENNLENHEQKLSTVYNYFNFLQLNLSSHYKYDQILNMDSILENLNEFMQKIKNYVLCTDNILTLNFPINLMQGDNEIKLLNSKSLLKSERKEKLLDTIYIKKSKTNYADDELLQQKDLELNIFESPKHKKIREKSEKLFLRNFMQIYFVKENGIFSESYFSKCNKKLLHEYKKFRFYEIKFFFSIQENFNDIQKYIQTCRKLLLKYIILYKDEKHKNFIKIVISGYGRRQNLVKRKLINFISNEVLKDCLIKICMYSNIFDSMSSSLKTFYRKKNYYFYSNFSEKLFKKIIKKINVKEE